MKKFGFTSFFSRLAIPWELIKIAGRSFRGQGVRLEPKITVKMYSYDLFFGEVLICRPIFRPRDAVETSLRAPFGLPHLKQKRDDLLDFATYLNEIDHIDIDKKNDR